MVVLFFLTEKRQTNVFSFFLRCQTAQGRIVFSLLRNGAFFLAPPSVPLPLSFFKCRRASCRSQQYLSAHKPTPRRNGQEHISPDFCSLRGAFSRSLLFHLLFTFSTNILCSSPRSLRYVQARVTKLLEGWWPLTINNQS